MQQRVDPATLFASVVKLLPEALIDSLAPASISSPRGVGWGGLRALRLQGGSRKGMVRDIGCIDGFVGEQAGVGRPNSEGSVVPRASQDLHLASWNS